MCSGPEAMIVKLSMYGLKISVYSSNETCVLKQSKSILALRNLTQLSEVSNDLWALEVFYVWKRVFKNWE